MNRLRRGIRWEENLDELSRNGRIPELTGFRTRTLPGLGTSLDSGLGRVISFSGTRTLTGFRLWNFRRTTPFWIGIAYRT